MVDRRFDIELLRLMVRSGCDTLFVGLETMNTRVLKLVHKSADREENLRFLREASAAGVRLRVNLIPDLPSTTYEEALVALEDVAALSECVDSFGIFPFEPTRSSNVGRDPERFFLRLGADGASSTGQAEYALNHLVSVDPAMSSAEREDIHRRYKAFAAEKAARQVERSAEAMLVELDDAGMPVRIAAEFLDVLDRCPDGVYYTNVFTRQRFRLTAKAHAILLPWVDGAVFCAEEWRRQLGEAVADRLIQQLLHARLLTEARPLVAA